MLKRNNYILIGLQVIAWIIFVGLSIEAGALIVNFAFNLFKPVFIPRLYEKLDLSEIYTQSKFAFLGIYSFILFIAVLKAYLFYAVIMLIQKLDLKNPFNTFVANQITKISYYTFSIGLISFIGRQTAKNLTHYGFSIDTLNQFWEDSQAFILMAAIIYVIATIFTRGVELQHENDLTV